MLNGIPVYPSSALVPPNHWKVPFIIDIKIFLTDIQKRHYYFVRINRTDLSLTAIPLPLFLVFFLFLPAVIYSGVMTEYVCVLRERGSQSKFYGDWVSTSAIEQLWKDLCILSSTETHKLVYKLKAVQQCSKAKVWSSTIIQNLEQNTQIQTENWGNLFFIVF